MDYIYLETLIVSNSEIYQAIRPLFSPEEGTSFSFFREVQSGLNYGVSDHQAATCSKQSLRWSYRSRHSIKKKFVCFSNDNDSTMIVNHSPHAYAF